MGNLRQGLKDSVSDLLEKIAADGLTAAAFGATTFAVGGNVAGIPANSLLMFGLFSALHFALSTKKVKKEKKLKQEVDARFQELFGELSKLGKERRSDLATELGLILEGNLKAERIRKLCSEILESAVRHEGDINAVQGELGATAEEIETWGELLSGRLDALQKDVKALGPHIQEICDQLASIESQVVSGFGDVEAQIQRTSEESDRAAERRHQALMASVASLNDKVPRNLLGERNETILSQDYSFSPDVPEVPRTELQKKVEEILWREQGQNSVLISGTAGVGKSGVIHQLCKKLQQEDRLFLYLRLDRVPSVETPAQIGDHLYSRHLSPAQVLKFFSRDLPAVLVVDQLDAVSEVSGRNPESFDCVKQLTNEAIALKNIRVVLACRKFDLENDHRLRALAGRHGIAEEVTVEAFSKELIVETVNKLGLPAELLTDKQIELLELPLHLKLLAETSVGIDPIQAISFETATDLFDRYWDKKRQDVVKRLGSHQDQWIEVIDLTTDQMSGSQSLSITREILDSVAKTAKAMESEHVLSGDKYRVGFFHESFFDYAFARRFCARNPDLMGILLDSEQHLFRRAQVRQVLVRLRNVGFARYIKLLKALLSQSRIRFHIKKMVIQLLGSWPKPRVEEWQVVDELLGSGDTALVQELEVAVFFRPAWFSLLHRQGVIQESLADPDRKTIALRGLSWCVADCPNESLECLKSFGSEILNCSVNLHQLFGGMLKSNDERLFEFFKHLMKEGGWEIFGEHELWALIFDLPSKRPRWAAAIMGQYLEWKYEHLPDAYQYLDFLGSDSSFSRVFTETAKMAPVELCQAALPFFIKTLGHYAEPKKTSKGGFTYTGPWSFRSYRDEDLHGVEGAIMSGLVLALQKLASDRPEEFEPLETELHKLNYEPVNFLLVRAYASGGEKFADTSASYLLEKPYRLRCGWKSAAGGDYEHWATYELLQAITPTCSDDLLARLEEAAMTAKTEYDTGKEAIRSHKRLQFVLLSGIAPDRRSEKAEKQLQQLRRRFGEEEPEPPVPSRVHMVGPPIPSDSAENMTDAQWLAAVEKHCDENGGWTANHVPRGGAREQAGVLQKQATEDPARFCRLLQRFPDNTNPAYFDHLLLALQDKNCAVKKRDAFAAIKRCNNLPGKPCGRWIPGVIAKFSGQHVYKYALEMVAWYAIHDPDPEVDSDLNAGLDQRLIQHGISTVRGAAAGAIARLLWGDQERLELLMPAVEKLVHDSSLAVRAVACEVLLPMLNFRRDQAVDLFLELVDCESDELLQSHYVLQFVSYACNTHLRQVRPQIDRMLGSGSDKTRQLGAELLTMSQFSNPDVAQEIEGLLSSEDPHVRKGIATIAAANIAVDRCREFCLETLPQLFDNDDLEVREEAAKCFRKLEGNELENAISIIEPYYRSQAFKDAPGPLIRALEDSTCRLPDITCEVCRTLLEEVQENPEFSGRMTETWELSKLLFRTYSQTKGSKVQSQCLDLIDDMLRLRIYGVDRELAQLDR